MARRPLGVLVACLLALSPALVMADDPAPACPHPARPRPGLACWAVPSDTGRYVGYPVGGGCLLRGSPPGPEQGTWGWDYAGPFHPHIDLLWCNCGRRRDVPAYRTTGTNVKGHSPSSP